MTQELYPLAEAQGKPITLTDDGLVAQCKSGASALAQTCIASGYTQETLAEKIGKAREVLSRACNGRGGLDPDVLIKVMNESASVFLLQYMCQKMGGEFRFVTPEEREVRQLEERLAILRASKVVNG